MRYERAAVVPMVLAIAIAGAQAQDAPKPIDVGAGTAIDVRLVTTDVVVLDDADRTVAGLEAADFRLQVDGTETPIDTFDAYCPSGSAANPSSRKEGDWTPDPAQESQRRIVFVIDYLHLPKLPCGDVDPGPCLFHTRVLDQLERVVESKQLADEEIMVAALTGGLRVEQPFTSNRQEVRRALQRMRNDVSLFAGNFTHMTERPLFDGLNALMVVLSTVPGTKGVVLFSGGSGPGADYEESFQNVALLASDARVLLHTVDVFGLGRGPT